MSSTQEVVILARLAGTRQVLADTQKIVASEEELAMATKGVGTAMEHTAKRSWLMNQALFTLRRLTYMSTLAFIGFGAAALKMGFDFNNAMQTATVALRPFFDSTEALNGSLNRLWLIAKYTPFQIKDMTLAFRALYPSLQTLGISADQTIDTIQALIDALSVAGKVTGPALQRATIALQHMAFQGRLTGITVNQLARDGIPMFAILHKELGINADQMKRIGDLGIPASVAMQAIVQYMQTTPGYANAAMRQSRMTLIGLWSTFKDNISRMSGMLQKEAFGGIQARVNQLDNWFNGFFRRFNGQAVSVREVLVYAFGAKAGIFWDQFAADLRLVWRIFASLVTQIVQSKAVWATLFAALVLLHGILVPLAFMVQKFGWALYVLIPALVTWKVTTEILIAKAKLQFFWTEANTKATKDQTFAMFMANRVMWAYEWTMIGLNKVMFVTSRWLQVLFAGYIKDATGKFVSMTATEKLILRYRILAMTMYRELVPAFLRTAVASTIAWIAMLGPIGWLIVAVTALVAILVVLYFKWKAFHDLVNATIRFMWDHPILLLFIPLVGWLIFAARMLAYFKGQWTAVWHFITGTADAAWKKIVSGLTAVWDAIRGFVNRIKFLFWPLAGILLGPFVILMREVPAVFEAIRRVVGAVFNWIGGKVDWLKNKIKGIWNAIPGHGIPGAIAHGFGKYVLGLANGGVLQQPGWTLVGERGPELLLLPGGAGVLPLPANTISSDLRSGHGISQPATEAKTPKPVFRGGSQYGLDTSSDRPLIIQLMLGRKVIEEVTVERHGSRMARR